MEKKFIAYSPKWDKLVYPNEGYTLNIGFDGASLWKDECVDQNVKVLQSCLEYDIDGKEIYEHFTIENVKTKSTFYIEDVVEFYLWRERNSIDTLQTHRIVGHAYEHKNSPSKISKINVIVTNTGYLNYNQMLALINDGIEFSIYKTKKGTDILVKEIFYDKIDLYFPREDRLPWKITEGKKIVSGEQIFNSKTDGLAQLSIKNWNNEHQIMSYMQFRIND